MTQANDMNAEEVEKMDDDDDDEGGYVMNSDDKHDEETVKGSDRTMHRRMRRLRIRKGRVDKNE